MQVSELDRRSFLKGAAMAGAAASAVACGTEVASVLAEEAIDQEDFEETPEAECVFVTDVGEIHILLPDDNDTWVIIQDPSSWFAISDGKDLITVDYYSDQEPPTEEDIDDEHYVEVVQEQFDLNEGTFLVTGYVSSQEDTEAIQESVSSFQLLSTEAYDISELDVTGYCIADDGANVWAEPSTDADIIGEVGLLEAIPVFGIVEMDGAFSGWLCVDYYGQTGYVWGDFFSSIDPEADFEDEDPDAVDEEQNDNRFQFLLHNSGWYVARLCVYTKDRGGNENTDYTDSITIGQTKDLWVSIIENYTVETKVTIEFWYLGWKDIGTDNYDDLDHDTSKLLGVVANCSGTIFHPQYLTEIMYK